MGLPKWKIKFFDIYKIFSYSNPIYMPREKTEANKIVEEWSSRLEGILCVICRARCISWARRIKSCSCVLIFSSTAYMKGAAHWVCCMAHRAETQKFLPSLSIIKMNRSPLLQVSLCDFVISINPCLVLIEVEYESLNAKTINPIRLLRIVPLGF